MDINLSSIQVDPAKNFWEDRKLELSEYFGLSTTEIEESIRNDNTAYRKHFKGTEQIDALLIQAYRQSTRDYAIRLLTAYERITQYEPFWNLLVKNFSEETRSNITVIDYGAGASDGGIYLARLGFKVVLVDVQGGLLDFAKWRFKKRELPVTGIGVTEVNLYPELPKAHAMILGDVLEHVRHPLQVLKNCVQCLLPPGFIVISHDHFMMPKPNPRKPQGHLREAYNELKSIQARRFLMSHFWKIETKIYRRFWRYCPRCGEEPREQKKSLEFIDPFYAAAFSWCAKKRRKKGGITQRLVDTYQRSLSPNHLRECPNCGNRWNPLPLNLTELGIKS